MIKDGAVNHPQQVGFMWFYMLLYGFMTFGFPYSFKQFTRA